MDNLTKVRKHLGRLERALIKADTIIKEADQLEAEDQAFLKAKMRKQLQVWLAQLEGPAA